VASEAAIKAKGITFTLSSSEGNVDRAWPFDVLPRVIPADEWRRVTEGLNQRLSALNHLIADLYADRKVIADKIVPEELFATSVNLRPECNGVQPPGGLWAHICGTDLVRDDSGEFLVLEDNLRVPSGVSYMLENRQISKQVLADAFEDLTILPVDIYTERLAELLGSLSPRPGRKPVIALLTPGPYNSAYYEHVMLAMRMGALLVEGSDLVVEDGVVNALTVRGPVRVDVIYRRVDDLFLDPTVFNPDSVLGVPGLMGAWAAGKVAIANAPGAGVADDKVVYSYVPDLIRYYLDEEAILPNVETWRCGDPASLSHVLANLDKMVVKPANESGGAGIVIGSRATRAELDKVADVIKADPRNWIGQPVLQLSTAPTICDGVVAPRHVDLRPFVLAGERPYVTSGGLTRVAMNEGSLVVNSSQGGGSKDTWVVEETS